MDKQQIFEQIQTLLVKLFELDAEDITLESRLYEELELDSIDAVDLVVHLQKSPARKSSPRCSNRCARYKTWLMRLTNYRSLLADTALAA